MRMSSILVMWLSWGLLRFTHSLAIWCQGWSASSICETAQVAWSSSNREPRSLHHTGGWELCIPGSLWRGGVSDSAILSLTVFQMNCWLWTSDCQDPCWLWNHWRWCYPGKWSIPLRLGWCPSRLMWGGLYTSHGGSWYNTSVFFRLMVRPKFMAAWEKQLTMCCRASPMWREGYSHQQTAAQWWVPEWFLRVWGDTKGWTDCCLFGNICRCHLAGPLLPHYAWCWRRWRKM